MSSIFELDRPERTFNSPTPGKITIMAGEPNSNNAAINNTLCSQLKASGFNSVAAFISNNNIQSSLNSCKINSLSLFLGNAGLINNTDTLINQYKNDEALGGWFLSEEINFNNDPLGLPWNTYQQAADNIKKVDSKHPIFIGMNGDWKYDTIGDPYASELTFPNRVRLMEQNFIPTFWPYCYFPDLSSPNNENAVEREATFYKDLRYFGYVSDFTGVPFWTFLRCSSLDKYGYHGDIPSIEMLRGQAFTSLAYGAQGLYYWGVRNILNNLDAMLNVTTVNNEIKIFNDVFFNCEVLDTRHVTNKKYPEGSVKILQNAIGPLEKVVGYGNDLLISQIFTPSNNNSGSNYLVIVANPFINNSASQTFQLIFNNYWNIFQLVKSGGSLLMNVMTNYSPKYTLEPGAYLIFKWT